MLMGVGQPNRQSLSTGLLPAQQRGNVRGGVRLKVRFLWPCVFGTWYDWIHTLGGLVNSVCGRKTDSIEMIDA